jgi:uncharacterized protein
MSNANGYKPGVPCWVQAVEPNAHEAGRFYGGLFGWDAESLFGEDVPWAYYVCKLHGREVAAVVSPDPVPAPETAVWSTHVQVQSTDETVERALRAGGSVIGEPFDSPGGGRVAVLADPAGAVICTWEPQGRSGAQLVNEPGAWAMSALLAEDVDAAKAFYHAVFGWESMPFSMGAAEAALWRVPGYVGGRPQQPVPRDVVAVLMPLSAAPGAAPGWGVDFWVSDADATAAKAAELGGSVLAPPHDIPGFTRAVLSDPFGAAFSVSQLIAPPQ